MADYHRDPGSSEVRGAAASEKAKAELELKTIELSTAVRAYNPTADYVRLLEQLAGIVPDADAKNALLALSALCSARLGLRIQPGGSDDGEEGYFIDEASPYVMRAGETISENNLWGVVEGMLRPHLAEWEEQRGLALQVEDIFPTKSQVEFSSEVFRDLDL